MGIAIISLSIVCYDVSRLFVDEETENERMGTVLENHGAPKIRADYYTCIDNMS